MISGVHISTSDLVLSKNSLRKPEITALKNNQIVKTKVLDFSPDGMVRLNINGRIFSVKTDLIFSPGESIELRVVKDNGQISLKLNPGQLSPDLGSSGTINRVFWDRLELPIIAGSGWGKVKDILSQIALKSEKPNHSFLNNLIEKGGLLFEKKIGQMIHEARPGNQSIEAAVSQLRSTDLKAALLDQFQMQSDAQGGKKIAAILETMENFQRVNHQGSESGRFLLPLPILSDAAFRFGQLLIDTGQPKDGEKRPKERVIHVSFLLDMSNLGPLRADFSVLKRSVAGRFIVSDDNTCRFVNDRLPELKHQLQSIDYLAGTIDCVTAAPDDLEKDSLVKIMTKTHEGNFLNIVI